MFKRGHRCLRRIWERGESAGGRERAVVVARVGSMRTVAALIVAGGDAPGVWSVTRKLLWILDAVFEIDAGEIAIIFEIVGEAIPRMRIEGQVRVMCEK